MNTSTTYYAKYKDTNNQWRWYLASSGNHKKIANSGEGYYNEVDCDHAINLVKASYNSPVHKV
jgi:uncharacterized protein YegP (UPF0339 family)